jgi:hypothetical protein
MNTAQSRITRLLVSAFAGTTIFTLTGVGPAGAQVMVRVPGDAPGIPAYARLEKHPKDGRFPYHNEAWAAIVFYRDPSCVPRDFNLYDMFAGPRAFGCGLTVSGFELWDNGPGIDAGPRHAISTGLAVPVWFVPWLILEAALADNFLTMPELESLQPLMGTATTFHEVIHPFVPPGVTGGAKVPLLTITASGVLPDGRSFQYHYTEAWNQPRPTVRIVFR